ncbi:cytochrome c oxidase subunit II [Rhodopseudomonas palustris]|uniref:cytochrome-c oxidase n=2 Tax=Rhodopseudomonas palustris TaxID=1076 RepID=A0AAX3DYE4_RHOPL|nr:cytochrome c oxidase subunit II [Rhodopseudomonas palustris]
MQRGPAGCIVAAATMPLAGCGGPLSTLDPAGPSAAAIAQLWWLMLAGAVVLFGLVMVLLLWAFVRRSAAPDRPKLWLAGGGLVLPVLVLMPLLGFGLLTGERLLAHPRAAEVTRIEVEARQWQWTFRYPATAGGTRVSVNELHLPVGRPVDLHVTSPDVIHGFWIPRLGGKIDAIPGHINVIRLSADRPGSYHGVCAEFCGGGHTAMDFRVTAHADDNYEGRLAELPRDRR